ncbi:MAG: hypothetical protein NTX61_06780 [Bacteroidetes bacterium]|nr:hypothetical protein [Bacteroidota bacterium]
MDKKKPSKPNLRSTKAPVITKTVYPVNYFAGIILAMFAFSLYMNSIRHDYALDDSAAITANKYVQEGLTGIPKLLTIDFWHFLGNPLGYYRPLPLITYAVEYQFFGMSPHVSHLNNVLLFALIVFLLFVLLSRIFSEYNFLFPFLITALFAAHPVHTEVIANIKGRDELLSFLNLTGMILLLLKYGTSRKKKWLWLSLLAFYFGLLSKESALIGIILVPFILYYKGSSTIKELIGKSWPYLMVIIFFYMQKSLLYENIKVVIQSVNVNYPYYAEDVRSSSTFMLFLFSLRLLILPFPLTHDYSFNQIPAVHWDNIWALTGLIVFFTLAIFSILQIKKRTLVGFGIGFLFISLIPFIGFILTRGGVFAERLLFAPVLGFAFLLILLFKWITRVDLTKPITFSKSSLTSLILPVSFCLVVLGLYAKETIDRNKIWYDGFTLFSNDLKTGSNCALLQVNYGRKLLRLSMKENDRKKKLALLDKGISSLGRAVEIFPLFSDAYYSLGYCYDQKAFLTQQVVYWDTAIYNYNHSIDCDQTNSGAYYCLANIYIQLKDYAMASYYYNMAWKVDPDLTEAKVAAQKIREQKGLDIWQKPHR